MGRGGGFHGRLLALLLLAAVSSLATSPSALWAEVVNGGNLRVSFEGRIAPSKLPRVQPAPVSLHVAGTVLPVDGRRPPALRRVKVELNRHGIVTTRGLPACPARRLLGTNTAQALSLCRDALVGSGNFRAHVEIPEGAPFPARGRLLIFNTSKDRRPALVAHVYGVQPVPTSQVLRIGFSRRGGGAFGVTFAVEMPKVGNQWGYVTGFDVTFHRLYSYHGRLRSFLAANCPAPAGIEEAPFTAARGTYFSPAARP